MSTDPITDAEVAGVPHCPSCGQPITAGHTPGCVYLITDPDPYYGDGTEAFADGHCKICGQPTGTDHDWSQHGGVADHVAILDGDDDDDPVDDVEPDDPDAIFDGLDATEEDLAPAAPGELDDDGTAAETGAVLDDDEDPGQPLPDDPFGPEYATGQA